VVLVVVLLLLLLLLLRRLRQLLLRQLLLLLLLLLLLGAALSRNCGNGCERRQPAGAATSLVGLVASGGAGGWCGRTRVVVDGARAEP
jgi:hypothetical protein